MAALRTGWQRPWRRIGDCTRSLRNRLNAVRTRSPASRARWARNPPPPLGCTETPRTSVGLHCPQPDAGGPTAEIQQQPANARVAIWHRIYRAAAERRGNTSLCRQARLVRHQSAPMPQALTYISIGFLGNLIYAEGNFGVDHNMLLIGRVCVYGTPSVPDWVTGCFRALHTFALSPQSVAIMAGRLSRNWSASRHRFLGGRGKVEPKDQQRGVNPEMQVWRGRRNKRFTGIYNELHDSGETIARFCRSLVVWREAKG
jgi:hypothetical protein